MTYAPFNARCEPVTSLEIDESGPHWQAVREMRNTIPGNIYKFRNRREVSMAVLLWEIREHYANRRGEALPDHLPAKERQDWFDEQKRMAVLIKRVDECLTLPTS